MSTPALPKNLRIGCVPYLNVKPLTQRLPDPLVYEEPSRLVVDFEAGAFDIALLPVAACFGHTGYRMLRGLGIGSDGPVYSVILALEKPLEDVKTVALHGASRSSAHLLRVLAARYFHKPFDYASEGADADAHLWIGNPAIEYRQKNPHKPVIDLGQAWKEYAGLPFVYAAWMVHPDSGISRETLEAFRELSLSGLQDRERIARNAFERHYLSENIRHRFDAAYEQGLARFGQELLELRLLKSAALPELV